MYLRIIFLLCCIILFSFNNPLSASPEIKPLRVLVVIAHPDDESILSVTLYKIAREYHGLVDLFVITNGEAGFKYSTLAEGYYGVALTDEKTARSKLPDIRRQELKNAGKILGISHYYFGNQRDDKYCLNEKQPLDSCWNIPLVQSKLHKVLYSGNYDFVFCLLPEATEHGAHKAATLLALQQVAMLPPAKRPIILGAYTRNKADSILHFTGYLNYTSTKTEADTALFRIDRTTSFSYNNRLNYKVIANWEIAEHKSQGATQMTMNDGDLEEFWYFSQNDSSGIELCHKVFNALQRTPYLSKKY